MSDNVIPSTVPASQSASIRPAGLRARVPGAASLLAVALGAALALPTVATAAGKLYRWSEPDGALTFSPTPPSDGTPYEEVDPQTMQKPVTASSRPVDPSDDSASVSATPSVPANVTASASPILVESPAAPAGTSASRPAMGAAMIERAQPAPESVDTLSPEIVAQQAATHASAATSANTKSQRCGELRKRVTSLEQRLARPLTPEDMDNTVVHMARYQQSFERHCN